MGARAGLSPCGVAPTAMSKGHTVGQLQPLSVSTLTGGVSGRLRGWEGGSTQEDFLEEVTP